MAIVYTTNVGVSKELSKDCSLPVPTVGYTNSDEGGLPFRMTRKSIPTTLLLLIEVHGLLLFLHLGVKVLAVLRRVWKFFQGLFYGIGEQVLTGSVDEGRFVGLFHDVDSKKNGEHHARGDDESPEGNEKGSADRLYERGRKAGYLRRRLLITLTKIATQTPPPISPFNGKSKVKLYATISFEISETSSMCIALLLYSPASPKAGFLLPAENVAGTRAVWCRNSLLSSKWHGIGTLLYGRRRVSARNLFRTHS